MAALAAPIAGAMAQGYYLGFNSGAKNYEDKVKREADYQKEFETQKKLRNAPGVFNSVRLFTNIQPETDDTPNEAFQAAINTNTSILLGIWCSHTDTIENELNALSNAIDQYGTAFTDLVVGISVGSEDMYRISEDGQKNEAGEGQEGTVILEFIKETRERLKDTALSQKPVGHVDTWITWVNASNKAVIDEVDFVGVDLYPYYEQDRGNSISNALSLFESALLQVADAAEGTPVWITETGWPSSGPEWGDAVASKENAKQYWDQVGCQLFGNINTWWYIMADSNSANEMQFGIGPELDGTTVFDLTCPAESDQPQELSTDIAAGEPQDLAAGSQDATSDSPESSPNSQNPSSVDTQESGTAAMVSPVNLVAAFSMVFALAAWAM